MRLIAHAARTRPSTFLVLALVWVTSFCLVTSSGLRAESTTAFTLPNTSQVDALPVSADEARQTLDALHDKFRGETDGLVASHNDIAASSDPNAFGIAIATVDGHVISVGDSKLIFPLQSLSKAFVFGLALKDNGNAYMLKKVGVHATGFPFGDLAALEVRATKLQNPMVSAGAISVTSTIAGSSSQEKWDRTLRFIKAFAGRDVEPMKAVFDAEMASNDGSLAKAWVLRNYELLYAEPRATVGRYLHGCSVGVSTEDLAIMGATLASGGINPKTKQRVVSTDIARSQLSAMVTAGMYDDSGPWLFRVGLPAKSGVSGGVVAVVPNRFAIAVYSPPLDSYGNSVRATKVIKALSDLWQLHVLQLSNSP